MSKSVIIIGSGFAGLSAASFMAKAGWKVTVLEKHATAGGRARQFSETGFTFDMGPSWYWMPDVFERYFQQFGKSVADYYQLERLDPSYRVYWPDGPVDIPATYEELQALFGQIEAGSGQKLDLFLKEAAYKYDVGIHKLVYKPGQSLTEFLDWELLTGVFKLDVFRSIKSHVAKYFTHPKLRELMEFPVLFLGALPEHTPALYSLMNYADIKGGTWYPQGGMYQIVKAMYDLAVELGVQFEFNQNVQEIRIQQNAARQVVTQDRVYDAKVVIGGADYHHIEMNLLPEAFRTYTPAYWNKRVMAPSCLLYYVGLNKRLANIRHHSLFFDTSFDVHGKEIYTTKEWPSDPLFYMSATSVTDTTVAPAGCENLFLLIPVATGLSDDSPERRQYYFEKVINRLEQQTGQSVKDAIIYQKSFAHTDFVSEYNAFRGNAYGLANTLGQTAVLKPGCRSKKVHNLFYTGQLTVPGPGVPPSLISGEVVAGEVIKAFG
ncbi:phytoene desaturase family protein [Sediminibacterium sp.]|uniref:phytoene desaturase family protein n=1 Tax=Sediminibacterium sp. TaxID=1917865 RepID=UPI0025FBAA88|nr:phytoene desaturase family protein [Sediminibacterium sp.]MBW0178882.1 phytoene desaturase [Sediminibacterium sp.]